MEIPPEIIDKKIKLEKLLADQEGHVVDVLPQKIGPTWSFKVQLSHKPNQKSIYFQGIPIVFEKIKEKPIKQLSKR